MKITATLLTSLLTSITVLGTDSDGDGLSDAFERGESRYEFVPGERTWKHARAHAEGLGGHLATITSDEEYQLIKSQLGGTIPEHCWLGATDENQEGVWEWVTGEPWGYTNWYPNQPDNTRDEQHYLFTGYLGSADKWDDIGNFGWLHGEHVVKPRGYIIEYPGAITDPYDADSDNDGFSDGEEHQRGTDPNDSGSRPVTVANVPVDAPLGSPALKCKETIANLEARVQELEHQLQLAIDAAETPFIIGWVYEPTRGWLYTDNDRFPLVYIHNESTWYYYEVGSSEPRWFYSYKTSRWEAWDRESESEVASN